MEDCHIYSVYCNGSCNTSTQEWENVSLGELFYEEVFITSIVW